MSTNNPFEKLNVKHEEEEDEQGAFEKVKGKVKNTPYGIEIKKRKTRPKEKAEEGNEEGFEEVKKGPKKRPTEDYAEDEQNQYKKGRRTKYERNEQNYEDNRPTRGRKYDRQSGTGRGREVAKGGAGGKHTWGDNPDEIARNYDNEDNTDDYYFNEALNAENKEKRDNRRRPKKDDENEGEEGKEGEDGDNKENKKEKKFEERKKIELKAEDKLDIPKNAIFLGDYLSKQKTVEEEKTEVKRVQEGKPLTKKVDKSNDDILGTSGAVKKKRKKKERKRSKKRRRRIKCSYCR